MHRWEERHWVPEGGSGISRADKQGGKYRAYVPGKLADQTIAIPSELSQRAAQIERRIIELANFEGAGQLESIARLLMRSEAISSSRIEGIAPNVDKVVLAELAAEEDIRGFKESAEAVARNLQVLRSVEQDFAETPTLTPEMLEEFQRELIGSRGRIPLGLREIQNWIGGASRTPIGAEFSPPPPELVRKLVEDLCDYLNGATHGALIQAAIGHAQFETIHPFTDGNGRVGRALIHGVLLRRGLTRQTLLPISLVLGTWSHRYIAGLTAFRADEPEKWIEIFLDATDQAITQAQIITGDLLAIQADWEERFESFRKSQGMVRALRRNSLEATLLSELPGHPIVTIASLQRLYGVGRTVAQNAVDNLTSAGILRTKTIGAHGQKGYYADDALELITFADRKLASSQFDTTIAPPNKGRGVPGLKN